MELVTHFVAKQPKRAMDLMRTMWGYIWNSPYAVQSSLIEGYYHDGRCHYPFTLYDPAYISHAHPWASGPTIVLTFYVVGLRLLNPEHTKWIFEPQPDVEELGFAMSGFTSDAKGFFSAGWKAGKDVLEMAVKAPEGTKGTIGVPTLGKDISSVTQNGREVLFETLDGNKSHVYIKDVVGGKHTVQVSYGV